MKIIMEAYILVTMKNNLYINYILCCVTSTRSVNFLLDLSCDKCKSGSILILMHSMLIVFGTSVSSLLCFVAVINVSTLDRFTGSAS